MAFLLPIWLVALIPWAGLTLWLLWGRHQRALVPFLPLWHGMPVEKRTRQSIELPPVALAAALLAILLAIFAAASPVIFHRARGIENLTIIVDRGMTMTNPRIMRASTAANDAIHQYAPEAKINLRIISGTLHENIGANWIEAVKSAAPTAVDDPEALQTALAGTKGMIIVITDQKLQITDNRIIQFSPGGEINDVGIDSFSVRASPTPSAMVAIRNDSDLKSCKLTVKSDDQTITKSLDLPPRGQTRNYFVDLPNAGRIIQASLDVKDDLPLDDRAWLVRRQTWPIVEARSNLPPALQRMIEVYAKDRPLQDGATHIAVISASQTIPSEPAAIIPASDATLHAINPQSLVVAAGPLKISDIDWPGALTNASVADSPPGSWTPIITAGGKVIVAFRAEPARQIWIGFDSPTFPHSKDFVHFWNEVFQYLGNGGDSYTSSIAAPLQGNWTREDPPENFPKEDRGLQPGLYRDADGGLQAINAPPVKLPLQEKIDGTNKLAAYQRATFSATFDLRPSILFASLILMLIALTAWQRVNKNAI